jgi:hypothetical protein
MRRITFVGVVLGLLVLTAVPALARATHTSFKETIELDLVVPASDSCTGEDVHDGAGGVRVIHHEVPHLVGEGLTSGDRYLPVGPLVRTFNQGEGAFPKVVNFVDHLNLIGVGGNASLILVAKQKLTINANGDTTVQIDEVKAACHG